MCRQLYRLRRRQSRRTRLLRHLRHRRVLARYRRHIQSESHAEPTVCGRCVKVPPDISTEPCWTSIVPQSSTEQHSTPCQGVVPYPSCSSNNFNYQRTIGCDACEYPYVRHISSVIVYPHRMSRRVRYRRSKVDSAAPASATSWPARAITVSTSRAGRHQPSVLSDP